jgi:acyl carrier protein
MNTHTEILKKLQVMILPYIKNQSINMDDDLVSDLGLDSLDMIDIIVQIEDSFDIKFADTELNELKVVGDLIEKIHLKSNGNYQSNFV